MEGADGKADVYDIENASSVQKRTACLFDCKSNRLL